jgi:hypothetical protein
MAVKNIFVILFIVASSIVIFSAAVPVPAGPEVETSEEKAIEKVKMDIKDLKRRHRRDFGDIFEDIFEDVFEDRFDDSFEDFDFDFDDDHRRKKHHGGKHRKYGHHGRPHYGGGGYQYGRPHYGGYGYGGGYGY